jgi:hypothetical protein
VFKALNHQAGSNGPGEELQDIINEAIPNEIIDVRFNQNSANLNTDEDFLVATYQAGQHIGKLAALKAAKAAKVAASGSGKEKEGQKSEKASGKARDGLGEKDPERTKSSSAGKAGKPGFGGTGRWDSKDEALKGLAADEKKEYGASKKNCCRCGRERHRTFECYASTTKRGTALLAAPGKSISSASKKRSREDDEEKAPVTK